MPGLLRGVARTAVVAGTASAVRGRVERRQAERFAERDANIYAQRAQAYDQQMYEQAGPSAPPAPGVPGTPGDDDVITQLMQLGELRDQGILTDAEFAAQKARILGV